MSKNSGRRVTQRDVARKMGVTAAAVSYAMNGLPGVSQELREQIKRTAEEMGYRPSRLAVSLRLGRTNTLGLLLPDVANPFYPELASGVIAAATNEGFQVFVSQVGLDGTNLQANVAALVDSQCEGLLFTAVLDRDVAMLEELRSLGIHFGFINRRLTDYDADWVGIDDHAAAQDLVREVVGGRRTAAVIAGPEMSSVSSGRAHGALTGLRAAGLDVHSGYEWGSLTRESGAERAGALLDAEGPVDLIIGGNDMIALGVLDACEERGLRVPDQVAVTGFDDMSFASAGPLHLTTVSVPRQQMGHTAVTNLVNRIRGADGPTHQERLPYQVVRRSTA